MTKRKTLEDAVVLASLCLWNDEVSSKPKKMWLSGPGKDRFVPYKEIVGRLIDMVFGKADEAPYLVFKCKLCGEVHESYMSTEAEVLYHHGKPLR